MKLPKRVPQHISETASFKLFSSKIPDAWIIRDITERDYGIDCYLELVNENNELSGQLALIQLKSRESIPWTKEDYYTIRGIDIATSNYWYKFSVPVFIFLADLEHQELYFLSVDYFIKRQFDEFIKQTEFNYTIRKSDRFEGKEGVFGFKFHFYYEYYRQQFENELLFFLSNLQHFQDFQLEHDGRDFHLGVEGIDLIFFEAMHRNYSFLSTYLNVDNELPSMREIKQNSRQKFPKGDYDLYEHDLTENMAKFRSLTVELIKNMKIFLNGELSYWLTINSTVYNYVINIKDDGTLPDW